MRATPLIVGILVGLLSLPMVALADEPSGPESTHDHDHHHDHDRDYDHHDHDHHHDHGHHHDDGHDHASTDDDSGLAHDLASSNIETRYKETLETPPVVAWSLTAELGFLAVVSHIVQLSNDGTRFDYRSQGGQDVLFPFFRLSTDLKFKGRHIISFLYQPLKLTGETVLSEDVVFDGVTFPAGTPLNSVYGFPFWRIGYMYDFLRRKGDEVALGFGLQIRNATITFTSADGTLRADRRDIGPVPLIEFRGRWGFENGVWWGTEIDGIYAPISGINGSDSRIVGALLDASLRVGYDFTKKISAFFNVRYLGGGAEGTESNPTPPGDGFTKNWLHFLTFSLGVEFRVVD